MGSKKINANKIFLFLSLLFVLIFIIYNVFIFSKFNFIACEDFERGVISANNWFNNIVVHPYHGRYISNFITCLFVTFLPKILNIHPVTFIQNIAPLFKGIFIFIITFQIASILYRNKSKDFLFPVIILFLYVLYQFLFAFKFADMEYCSFYGFPFPFIFFNIFWFEIIFLFENIDKTSNYDKNMKKRLIFYAFLVGISTEFTNITTFFALFFLLVTSKKLYKILIAPFLSLSLGIIIYYSAGQIYGGYSSWIFTPPINETISKNIIYVKPFLLSVMDVLSHIYLPYLIIILVLTIFIFLRKKATAIASLKIIYSLITGSIIFFLFLICAPEDCPNKILWTYHFELVSQYKILYATLIIYALSLIDIKALYKRILIVFIIISVLYINYKSNLSLIYEFQSKGYYNTIKEKLENGVKERYLLEKINLWNIKNKKTLALTDNNFFLNGGFDKEKEFYVNVYNLPVEYDLSETSKFNSLDEIYLQYKNDFYQKEGNLPNITNKEIEVHDFEKLRQEYNF